MNQKKKILITLPSLQDPGGVASYFNALLPHLQNSEYIIKILEIGSTKGHSNKFYPLLDQLDFRQNLISYKPDLVHINPSLDLKSFLRDGLFLKQAKRKRLPVVTFFHGWGKSFEQVIRKRCLQLFRKTFGQADAFIVLANEFKDILHSWGINQKIHLGYTTVDESLLAGFAISNKLAQIKKSTKVKVLFLARLERAKGIFETVDAITHLLKKGLPVLLSIAGDGPIRDELADYIVTKKLSSENIKMLGYLRGKDKINALSNHDIYCFPTSYGEGLPTSVLEAMSFGMPVVTKPVGGLADIFQDGVMGYLCKQGTPEEIAKHLTNLVENKKLLLQISEYNHQFAKEHFMASDVAERLLGIYTSTLYKTNDEHN